MSDNLNQLLLSLSRWMQRRDKQRMLMVGVYIVLGLPVLAMLSLVVILSVYHFQLPAIDDIQTYQPKTASRIYSTDGILIGEYAEHKRVHTPYDQIPPHVINAFIAAEDKNFWHHGGIDLMRLGIATITNVRRWLMGQRLQGASTITQQVARNLYLSREVSMDRKLKEMVLAMRLEGLISKERIMEIYLSEIYLGGRSYGVAHAAHNYFGKRMDDLHIHESALLAGLPKAPSYYNPRRYPKRALQRRNTILARMAHDGLISDATMRAYQSLPLGVRDSNERAEGEPDSNYFVEEARLQLIDIVGEEPLYTEGLTIYATLDSRLQDIAERALRDGLTSFDQRQGWRGALTRLPSLDQWQTQLQQIKKPRSIYNWQLAVVLQTNDQEAGIGLSDGCHGSISLDDMLWARRPLTQEEEQMVADKKYDLPLLKKVSTALSVGDVILVEKVKDEESDASLQREADCREYPERYALRQIPEIEGAIVAMNVHNGRIVAMSGGYSWDRSLFNRATQALRQPGSSFKPFVYLAALDNGFTPTTEVIDAPLVLEQGEDEDFWRPENYSEKFYGPTLLRRGLERSRNLITIRLAHSIGMTPIMNYANLLGVLPEDAKAELSVAIGSRETTLLQLTTAYAMFANGGLRVKPAFIERIQKKSGDTIYRRDERDCASCVGGDYDGMSLPPFPQDERARVIEAPLAYQMVSMLEGVVERGTGRRARIENVSLAGKTGTTNDHKDVWFIGFTPDVALGVFVGYDQPRSMGVLANGATVSSPIFKQFMWEAFSEEGTSLFRVPEGIHLVRINRITGMPVRSETDEKYAIFEALRTTDTEDLAATVGRDAAYGRDRLLGRDKTKKLLGLY